jgi:DNA-binding NarL/FixJ family response regulator
MPAVRNILLVDDHPVVRQGLARILSVEVPDLRIVEAVDGQTALARLRAETCHLVLLDLTLPGEDGLQLLRRIRREFPSVPVLIVSMHAADQFEQRALQAGADGYVTKDSDPQALVGAVRAALARGVHVPPDEGPEAPASLPPHEMLSDREYQVLRLIGVGRTVGQIAAELGLSVKTISTYRGRILEKLELRSSAEIIHYAVVNRLVP